MSKRKWTGKGYYRDKSHEWRNMIACTFHQGCSEPFNSRLANTNCQTTDQKENSPSPVMPSSCAVSLSLLQSSVFLAVCILPQKLWSIFNLTLSDRDKLHVVFNRLLSKCMKKLSVMNWFSVFMVFYNYSNYRLSKKLKHPNLHFYLPLAIM